MLSLLGPALKLWLEEKIYTVERLMQTCYDVLILSGCPYYPDVHIKVSSLEKVTDT